MSKLLDEALRYESAGYSVIPIRKGQKKPLIEWTEFQRRRATRQEIIKWWTDYPDANIGVVTGRISGVVVVDCDPKNGGDARPIVKEYPTGLIQRTGSGGYHLFYKYPENVDWVQNQTKADGRNGIDIRADGGYVVVAPSTHDSGKQYEFVRIDQPTDPPPFAIRRTDHVSTSNQEEPWVTELLQGAQVGNRNDTMARLVGYFASKKIPIDITRQTLLNWNAKNDQPLPNKEIEATLRSIYRIEHERRPRVVGREETKIDFVSAADYIRQYGDEQISWQVQDWLPAATVGFVASPPGGFKTWLLLDLAIAVAGGGPFLDKFPAKDPGTVLILQQEDHRGDLAHRFQTIYYSRQHIKPPRIEGDEFISPALPKALPIYFHPSRAFRLDDESAVSQLSAFVEEKKPKLVLIDPLYSITSTDEYMAKTAEQLFIFKSLRDRTGASFLLAHHTRKSPGENSRSEMWGSQFLNAWLETGWQVRRDSESESKISIHRHFKSAGNMPLLNLEFDLEVGAKWRYNVQIVEKTEDGETIERLLRTGVKKPADIAKALGIHRMKAQRMLDKLEASGAVVKDASGWSLSDSVEDGQQEFPKF